VKVLSSTSHFPSLLNASFHTSFLFSSFPTKSPNHTSSGNPISSFLLLIPANSSKYFQYSLLSSKILQSLIYLILLSLLFRRFYLLYQLSPFSILLHHLHPLF